MSRRRRKKQKKKKLLTKKNLLGIFIVSIMVLSGVGYMWTDPQGGSSEDYNDYKFVSQNNQWYTNINDQFVAFSHHPSDIDEISVGSSIDLIKQTKMLYITFDPDSLLVSDFEIKRLELENELSNHFTIFPITGVTKNNSLYGHFPIINCINATPSVPVIYFVKGNETKIIQNGSCITLQAVDGYDVSIIKDRLMFGLFGIIE
jgi:hypothetical protein